MQDFVYNWVADVARRFEFTACHTLEVGSFDVNGTVDSIFRGQYWGVDKRHGPGVDQVADGENLPFSAGSYDVVVSTETLEHVERPWRFVSEMARVCKSGGAFPEHDVPHDYWRFGDGALDVLLLDAGLRIEELLWNRPQGSVCALAFKP